MGLTKMTADVEVISKLSTFPNAEDGLTPEQLKAKFDHAGKEIKGFINDTLIPELEKGGFGSGDITVARKGSEAEPVSLSGYGIGAGDVVRFQEGDYYVEPFDMEGLDHVTFLLGDARIHCAGDHFLEATRCDDIQIIGGTVMGGNGTVMGIQIKDCLRPVLRQVCFNGIGSATVEDTKGLTILGDCTGFLVDRCVVNGVSAGVVSSDGWIHAYGILVNRLGSTNAYSRKGQILHCRIANVAGIDTDTVKADGDGIFIQRPPYLNDSGKVAGIDQVIDIDGCVFANCKKRGVKSAAWGTTVRDCEFRGEFYYAPVDLQYGHGTVDRCRIYNASNYTKSVTSGVVANDGGFTVRDTYINCLYVNEDGTNGRHPGVRMDKRQPGSIFDKSVPWDPILVERCHFDQVNYGVYAGTSVSGVDTYRLTALEVLDCRWGAHYHDYAVDIKASVFDRIDVVRFVDFRFDGGRTLGEVRGSNPQFSFPLYLDADPTGHAEYVSKYWLDQIVTSSKLPTAPNSRVVNIGDGCRKEYTGYGSRTWGSGDPNGKVSGDPEYALLLGSKVGDEYTDTATGKKYVCTATGGVGVWTEVGSGSSGNTANTAVHVGPEEPEDEDVEVWFDTDEEEEDETLDGAYYVPNVTDNGDGTVDFGFLPSSADLPAVETVTVELPKGEDGAYTGDADGIQAYLDALANDSRFVARFDKAFLVASKILIPENMTIIGGAFLVGDDYSDVIFSAQGDNVRLIGVTMAASAQNQTAKIYTENGRETTAKDSNTIGFYSNGHEGVALINCVTDKIIPAKINNGSGAIRGCRITDCSMFVWGTNVRITAADNDVSICDTGLDYYYHVYYVDQDSELYTSNNRIRCDTSVAYFDIYHPMTAGNDGTYRAKVIADGDVIVGNFQHIIDCHYADVYLKKCHIVNTNPDSWDEFENMGCSSFVYEGCYLDYAGAAEQSYDGSMISGRDIPEGVEPAVWKGAAYPTCYVLYDRCRIFRTSTLSKRATYRGCDIDLIRGTDQTVVSNLFNVIGCRLTVRGAVSSQVVDGTLVSTVEGSPLCIGSVTSSDAKFDFCNNHVVFVQPNTAQYLFRYASLDGCVCNNVFSGVAAGTTLWYGGDDLGISQNNVIKEVSS